MALKKRQAIAHIKARSKHSSHSFNHWHKKKAILSLIKLAGVSQDLCAVCVCASLQVLLLPVGRGIVGPCFTIEARKDATMIGGCVPVWCDL